MIRITLPCLVLALATCAEPDAPEPLPGPFVEVPSPAGPNSGQPRLSTDGEEALLSWVEEGAEAAVLRFSWWNGGGWSEPIAAAQGEDWFVNWADTPGVVPLGGGRLAVHYLQRTGEDTYAYGVRAVRSDDGGRTWSPPVAPHRDGTPTEHGFVSALPTREGVRLVWLDGRDYHDAQPSHAGGGHGGSSEAEMSLRTAVVTRGGSLQEEALLDARTCDCCPTAAVVTPAGAVVAYRDRSEGEIRDIAVVRRTAEGWTEPTIPHPDGWHIAGCPVNGPALAAEEEAVALAWFTGAPTPRVQVAHSTDGGVTFGPAARVDLGSPAGRVGVVAAGEGGALVSWIERSLDNDAAALLVRHVSADGALGRPHSVTEISADRASGMPQLLRLGDAVFTAWTDPGAEGEPPRVRVARADLGALR